MKLNPYEQGAADYKNGVRGGNPFPTFTQRWALYNRGYNQAAKMSMLNEAYCTPISEMPQGSGRMQGRGAA